MPPRSLHFRIFERDARRRGQTPAERIRELYVGEALSQKQLAKRLGVSVRTVQNWMRALGLSAAELLRPGEEPREMAG